MDFTLRGELVGHTDWVTAVAVAADNETVVSASRDKSLLRWKIVGSAEQFAKPLRRLTGHNHFVQDVVLSSDGQYALSASWDTTLRLWDLNTGKAVRLFRGHTKDVLSVAFSADNRQIVSSSRDRSIKLWNTLGECKYTFTEDGHSDWVSSVRFSPASKSPLLVSGGWDKMVKVWNLNTCRLHSTLVGNTAQVNSVAVSPDGSLCAAGDRDGKALLWDVTECKYLSTLEADSEIHYLAFSPNRYWLCAATTDGVKIFDLESKKVLVTLQPPMPAPVSDRALRPYPICVTWSPDGSNLFVGYTDHIIRVYNVAPSAAAPVAVAHPEQE